MMGDSTKHTTIAEELRSGGSVTYFTVGNSMRPLLKEHSTHVTIAPITEGRSGDLLLYIRENGDYVLHRCIKQDENYYYMRGDHTYRLEKIKREQVIGIVTHIYRKGKTISVKKRSYRAYSRLWRILYPCRWMLYKICATARAVFSKK